MTGLAASVIESYSSAVQWSVKATKELSMRTYEIAFLLSELQCFTNSRSLVIATQRSISSFITSTGFSAHCDSLSLTFVERDLPLRRSLNHSVMFSFIFSWYRNGMWRDSYFDNYLMFRVSVKFLQTRNSIDINKNNEKKTRIIIRKYETKDEQE